MLKTLDKTITIWMNNIALKLIPERTETLGNI